MPRAGWSCRPGIASAWPSAARRTSRSLSRAATWAAVTPPAEAAARGASLTRRSPHSGPAWRARGAPAVEWGRAPPRRRGRRGGQPGAPGATPGRAVANGEHCLLSAHGILHRQWRDDRLRRGAALQGRQGGGRGRLRIFGAAALGLGGFGVLPWWVGRRFGAHSWGSALATNGCSQWRQASVLGTGGLVDIRV